VSIYRMIEDCRAGCDHESPKNGYKTVRRTIACSKVDPDGRVANGLGMAGCSGFEKFSPCSATSESFTQTAREIDRLDPSDKVPSSADHTTSKFSIEMDYNCAHGCGIIF